MRKPSSLGKILVVLLLISAYVFAKFQGGFVSWFLFYAFLPIGLSSLLYGLFVFRGLRIEREVAKHTCTAGDSITITYHVRNPYRIPLVYVWIEDHIPAPLYKNTSGQTRVVSPWFKRGFSLTLRLQNLPRGVFRWNDIRLQSGDLFGFVKKEKIYTHPEKIVVYPYYQEINHWPAAHVKNAGISHVAQDQQTEEITSVAGARDYAPGDRLGHIHWKVSARTGRLKTMEFESSVTRDVLFFLDREQSAYGREEHALFEQVVSLTAALIHYGVQRHFSCGLVSDGKERTRLRMGSGQELLYRIWEHLARIKADAPHPVVQAVEREIVGLPPGTTVVVISPQLDRKMADLLGILRQRHIQAEFFWVKGPKETTKEEKSYLTFLHREQLACHVISEDFNRSLTGGPQHVTA